MFLPFNTLAALTFFVAMGWLNYFAFVVLADKVLGYISVGALLLSILFVAASIKLDVDIYKGKR